MHTYTHADTHSAHVVCTSTPHSYVCVLYTCQTVSVQAPFHVVAQPKWALTNVNLVTSAYQLRAVVPTRPQRPSSAEQLAEMV